MTASTQTVSAIALQHLWDVGRERLAETKDLQDLAWLLSFLSELESDELPIADLTQMYLQMATDVPASVELFTPDLDDDVLKPCREMIERAPEHMPVPPVIAALRTVYATEEEEEDQQARLQSLVECLVDVPIDMSPFIALLQDPAATIRCGGLDALFYLGRSDGMEVLLDDPDAHVRRLAIDNLGALGALPLERVQVMATDDPDELVRAMAIERLDHVAGMAEPVS